MRKKIRLWIIAIAVVILSASSLCAQDISGNWQGTLKGPSPGTDLRLVLSIKKNDNGELSAMCYSIDQPPEGLDGYAVSSLTLQGSDFKLSIESLHVRYEGKLRADGNSIKGIWNGRRTLPLDFERTTKATAWHYELPQHSISFIDVDKDVKLEVLDYGGSGRLMIFLAGLGATAHVFDRFAPKFIAMVIIYLTQAVNRAVVNPPTILYVELQ
jgi:non-heme chloroperoxidase